VIIWSAPSTGEQGSKEFTASRISVEWLRIENGHVLPSPGIGCELACSAEFAPPTIGRERALIGQRQKVRAPMNCFTSASAFALSKP
jgi:hypothetical protein